MAQTTTSKKPTRKATQSRRGAAASQRHPKPASSGRRAVGARTAELSEDVLRSLEDGQRAAIDAVHGFVDRVDRTLPALPREDGGSRRQEIIDSALEMADRLVHAQYEFIREVIDSTGRSLAGPGAAKGASRRKSPAGGKGTAAKKRR
jgi:hypothetical protein